MLSAVHSDRSGRLMLVADYAPAMIDGAGVRPFEGGAPLSRGAEIITLTGREAVGIDRAGRPRPLGPARFAVAAIARLGSLRTALPAYAEDERVPALAARAYAAVAGDANGGLLIAAAPIDPDATANDLRDDPDLPARISVVLGELPGNRLARQLARCARDYRCRAAANAFAGVADCALPVAAPANERPPDPVSIRGDVDAAPTEAAAFHPTADEIAAVAVRHFAAGGTLVSFGRACEGEPLLAARLLEAALEMIRARTATGTLHVETNGSSPAALRRLIAAGLDSVAVRLASARAATYERLHGPQGYRFGDVRTSIDAAVPMGATAVEAATSCFVSIPSSGRSPIFASPRRSRPSLDSRVADGTGPVAPGRIVCWPSHRARSSSTGPPAKPSRTSSRRATRSSSRAAERQGRATRVSRPARGARRGSRRTAVTATAERPIASSSCSRTSASRACRTPESRPSSRLSRARVPRSPTIPSPRCRQTSASHDWMTASS